MLLEFATLMARAVFPMPGGPCNIMHLHSCVWSRHLKILRHSRSRLTEMWHRLREVRSIPWESREPDGTIIIIVKQKMKIIDAFLFKLKRL